MCQAGDPRTVVPDRNCAWALSHSEKQRQTTNVKRACDLMAADHKVSTGLSTRFSHSMDTILSVQNQNFSGDGKKFTKVSRTVGKAIIDTLSWYWTWLHNGYPCKSKTCRSSWRPKVIYTDSSLEFGKACEELPWNHFTSTLHRSETNGIAERAVRRLKEGTSVVAVTIWFGRKVVGGFHGMLRLSAKRSRPLIGWETQYERRFRAPFEGPVIPFGSMIEYHPISCERPVKTPPV